MSHRKRTRRLNLEALEDRRVPATWGVAWPEPQHLTVSFVPDGTTAGSQTSQLFATLDRQLGSGQWEATILQALQTWAASSNINIGLVSDGGEPLGTNGPAQGDVRFGDIRISAEPLPSDVVAITAPYNPSYGTTSGDLILNSSADFNPSDPGSYDLFTVALHEAGHVFGFADSSDPSNFMYNVYGGPVTGLAPGAVPALQALYGGARNIDGIDHNPVSTDPSNPVAIGSVVSGGVVSASLPGDLATPQQSNDFSFQAPGLLAAPLGLNLSVNTAGNSLLTPKVTVTDTMGHVVATSAASSPLDGGTSVYLLGLIPGQTYNVQVTGATGDVFSVGSYQLTFASALFGLGQLAATTQAQPIPQPAGNNTSSPLTVVNTISPTDPSDAYSFTTPLLPLNGLTVNLRDWGIGLGTPSVTVENSLGIAVGSATASPGASGTVNLHLPVVLPNSKYYLLINFGKPLWNTAGTYQASISFAPPSSANASNNFALAIPWIGGTGAASFPSDSTVSTAVTLPTPTGEAPLSRYEAIEGINGSEPQHFYRITTPNLTGDSSSKQVMTVSVQTLGTEGLLPMISVFDQNGNAVNAQVLTEQDGTAVVQVALGSTSNQYVLEVSSAQVGGTPQVGNYYLDATFGNTLAFLGPIASGTLAASPAGSPTPTVSIPLPVDQSEIETFVLSGSASNTGTDAILQLTIVGPSGNVLATLSTPATQSRSLSVTLPAGNCTVLITASSPSGRPIPQLVYALEGTNLTDPIKVYTSSGSSGATPAR